MRNNELKYIGIVDESLLDQLVATENELKKVQLCTKAQNIFEELDNKFQQLLNEYIKKRTVKIVKSLKD